MSNKYILYIHSQCPFCDKAVKLLKEKDKKFGVLDLKTRPAVLNELKEIYEWTTVPMIFKRTDDKTIKFIGGYSDLAERLEGH